MYLKFTKRVDVSNCYLRNGYGEVNYTMIMEDGRTLSKKLDKNGRTERIYSDSEETVEIIFESDDELGSNYDN